MSRKPRRTPAPFAHERRAYRALVGRLGLSEQERRDLNIAVTGHDSSSDFDLPGWNAIIAHMQQLAGRPGVRDGKPHLRASKRTRRRRRLPAVLTGAANAEQVETIESLAAQILWDRGGDLEQFIRAIILREPAPGVVCVRWGGSLSSLDARAAALTIAFLEDQVASQTCPRCGRQRCGRDPETTRHWCPACKQAFGRRARRRERQAANV